MLYYIDKVLCETKDNLHVCRTISDPTLTLISFPTLNPVNAIIDLSK